MRQNPRSVMVRIATLDLREKLNDILRDEKNPLDYEDILIPVAKVKCALLRAMQHPGSMLIEIPTVFGTDFKVHSAVMAAMEGENALTAIEVYHALTEFEINDCAKYMLRYERHGNYEKSAYEA